MVEWQWLAKLELFRQEAVPVPQCPSQIPHVPARDRTESEEFAEKEHLSKAGLCSLFIVTRRYTRPQVFMADNMA
jgi:hypothetical protein